MGNSVTYINNRQDSSFQFCSILLRDILLETSFKDVSNDISHDRIGLEWNEIFQIVEFEDTMEINHRVWRLKTYKFYPKANYFRKRIASFWPRFSNIINSFPPRFHFEWEKNAIDEEAVLFNRDLEITVTGNEKFPLSKFIISEGHEYTTELVGRPQGAGGDDRGFCLYIIYICIEDVTRGTGIIKAVIDAFKNSIELGSANQKYIEHTFVFCEINSDADNKAVSDFRDFINSHMLTKVSSDWPGDEHTVIGPDPIMLGSKISNHLENAILDTFDMMYNYLDHFVYKGNSNGRNITDIAHVQDVEIAILDYLRLGINSSDLYKQLQEEADMANEDQVIDIVLDDMNKKIKCVIADPISRKLAMKLVITYQCLDEINYTKIIKNSISKVTKMQLARIANAVHQKNKINQATTKNDFLRYGLLNDLSLAFRTIEKDLKNASMTIDIMGKLQFEIEGCFKVAGQKKAIKDSTPKLPEPLKKDLTEMDGIIGFGNIYGKLEIHIKQDASIQSYIDDALRRHNFSSNYSVKTVKKEASTFASIQYEQGNDLLSPWPGEIANGHPIKYRKGTIGMFLESQTDQECKTLYALTAAHVVNPFDKEEHDVFVIGRSQIKKKFGVSMPKATVNTGKVVGAALMDIAAVKVEPDMQRDCIRFVKDEEGMPKRPRIKVADVTDLEKIPVYKFGAETKYTQGIVVSGEYINRANRKCGTDYIVLIDKLPGMQRPFAIKGDSGAVVCTPCFESERHIELLAMITGGGLQLEEDHSEYCFSFQLNKGIEVLEEQMQLQLRCQ